MLHFYLTCCRILQFEGKTVLLAIVVLYIIHITSPTLPTNEYNNYIVAKIEYEYITAACHNIICTN